MLCAQPVSFSRTAKRHNELVAPHPPHVNHVVPRYRAAHCQQVLAGIGFTTDHAFHRHLKRTMMLDGLFGSADRIATDLGRQLIAARRVPTLIEL